MNILQNTRIAWTPADEQRLRDLATAGLYLREIANQLGRTQEAVRSRANKLRVPVRSGADRQAFRRDVSYDDLIG